MARKKIYWPWLAWAAFILVAAVALASCDAGPPTTGSYGGLPPERFRGDATTMVSFVSDPSKVCSSIDGKRDPEGRVFGCTIIQGDGSTHMVLLNPCLRTHEVLTGYCHELGHVNTWPWNHGP